MVTTKVNYTYLEFDRPVFNNILYQPKLGGCGHCVMDNHGNYVYEKTNTDRTVANMEWAD